MPAPPKPPPPDATACWCCRRPCPWDGHSYKAPCACGSMPMCFETGRLRCGPHCPCVYCVPRRPIVYASLARLGLLDRMQIADPESPAEEAVA